MKPLILSLLLILSAEFASSAMAARLHCQGLFSQKTGSAQVPSAVLGEMADLWREAQLAPSEETRHRIARAFADRLMVLQRETGIPRDELIAQIRHLLPADLQMSEKSDGKDISRQRQGMDTRLRWDLIQKIDTGYLPPVSSLGLNSNFDEPRSGFAWTSTGHFFGLRGFLPGGKGDVTRIFSAQTGRELPIQFDNGTFSQDGDFFAAKVGNEIQVWDLNQPARPAYVRPAKGTNIIALNADLLVVGTWPKEVQWIYLKNGDVLETRFPWSYDSRSRRLAFFDHNEVLKLIDAATGQEIPVPGHLKKSRPLDGYAYFSNPMVLEIGSGERVFFLSDLTDYHLPVDFYIERTVREKILILGSSQPLNKVKNQVINFATGKVVEFSDPAVYNTDGKRYLVIASETEHKTTVFDFTTWKVSETIPERIWVIKGRYLLTKKFSSSKGFRETTIYDMENKQTIGVPESGDWRLFEFDQATAVESQSLRVFDLISQKVTEFPKQDMHGEVLISPDGQQALQQFSTHLEVYRLSQ